MNDDEPPAAGRLDLETVAIRAGRSADGPALAPVLWALLRWGDRYAAPDGPPVVVEHRACGHDAAPQMHCSHCGEALEPADVAVRPGPGAAAA